MNYTITKTIYHDDEKKKTYTNVLVYMIYNIFYNTLCTCHLGINTIKFVNSFDFEQDKQQLFPINYFDLFHNPFVYTTYSSTHEIATGLTIQYLYIYINIRFSLKLFHVIHLKTNSQYTSITILFRQYSKNNFFLKNIFKLTLYYYTFSEKDSEEVSL